MLHDRQEQEYRTSCQPEVMARMMGPIMGAPWQLRAQHGGLPGALSLAGRVSWGFTTVWRDTVPSNASSHS
jgi:hypothetical protein